MYKNYDDWYDNGPGSEAFKRSLIKCRPIKNDKILMPKELTAENGAKALLIGEFSEKVYIPCLECEEDCEECTNHYIPHKIPISWTNIKAIYAMAVKHLGKECNK